MPVKMATGIFVALAGMITFPFLLVIALGAIYQRFGDLTGVRDALRGMAAVAAGLILATAIKMAVAMYRKKMPLKCEPCKQACGCLLLSVWDCWDGA